MEAVQRGSIRDGTLRLRAYNNKKQKTNKTKKNKKQQADENTAEPGVGERPE